jgi:hypothetical protein
MTNIHCNTKVYFKHVAITKVAKSSLFLDVHVIDTKTKFKPLELIYKKNVYSQILMMNISLVSTST